jgi:hypothetical protein
MMFQVVTLGMRKSFFEVALFDALANLKKAVEDEDVELTAVSPEAPDE